MTKLEMDQTIVEQIRNAEGTIELVDRDGQTVGIVRRPPLAAEIERARARTSRGGETLTWEQVRTKL